MLAKSVLDNCYLTTVSKGVVEMALMEVILSSCKSRKKKKGYALGLFHNNFKTTANFSNKHYERYVIAKSSRSLNHQHCVRVKGNNRSEKKTD